MRNRTVHVPRWRAPFLKALSETGSIKLAAGRAPVDPSHIYRLRRRDPDFAADWTAALEAAAQRLGGQENAAMPGCKGDALRGELVLFRTRTGKPHLRAPRANGWTRAKEAIFLKTLASTCNVLSAAKAANVTPSGAYQRRMRWAGFEAAWNDAVDNGIAALEARILETTINIFAGTDTVAPQADLTPRIVTAADMENAISLLNIHKRQMAGDGRHGGKLYRATEEETNEATMRQLKKLEQRRNRAKARAEKAAILRGGA